MSQENLEIVRRIYDAFVSGDFGFLRAHIHPEIVVEMSAGPEPGVRRGRQAVTESLERWVGAWEGFRVEVLELIDAGDHVIAVNRNSGRGRGSGLEVSAVGFNVLTLVDVKVTRMVWCLSRAEALEAAGLSE